MRYTVTFFFHGKWRQFGIGLVIILLVNFAFKYLFTPSLDHMGIYSLVITPKWMDSLRSLLTNHPLSILLPQAYPDTDGKTLWAPTTLVPLYYLYQVFSPLAVYVATSSLFLIAVYLCGWYVARSVTFSFTMGILFALGTQLNYALTYGVLLALYILFSYISINITVCICILKAKYVTSYHYLLFAVSLLICALGGEFWLNYCVSLILCLSFLVLWGKHHDFHDIKSRSIRLIIFTVLLLVTYLLVEASAAQIYFKPGVEEELIFTYSNPLLMIDDLIVNYFTFLYASISNYLPSFLCFSNSATYLGEARILAEQNGYHAQKAQLVIASHIFEWRFYAGILFTVFFITGWRWLQSSWQEKKMCAH